MTCLTARRPPAMARFPRSVPLSCATRANPVSAATSSPVMVPISGISAFVWADKGYVHAGREAFFTKYGDAFWGDMCKAPKGDELDEIDEQINRIIAKGRAKVEHPFRILKRQFDHVKTRYKGLAKNRAHLFTLYALGNLFLMRQRLMAWDGIRPKSTKSPLRRPKQRENRWFPAARSSKLPASRNVGAAEGVDQEFLNYRTTHSTSSSTMKGMSLINIHVIS